MIKSRLLRRGVYIEQSEVPHIRNDNPRMSLQAEGDCFVPRNSHWFNSSKHISQCIR